MRPPPPSRSSAEVPSAGFAPIVAYRDGRRLVQEFDPTPIASVRVPSQAAKGGRLSDYRRSRQHRPAIAEALATRCRPSSCSLDAPHFRARLVGTAAGQLTRRCRESQDSGKLLKFEALGAELLVMRADVADAGQMTTVVNLVDQRFGVIHGVIHGSGNTTAAAFIDADHTDRPSADQHFRPKAHGTLVLEELLRGRDLDFVLLLSSLSGVLGGLGLLGYASANIFLDAFAARENQAKATPWVSVSWDAWQFPGQEALFRNSASPGGDFLYPAEGVECFRRILEQPAGQIVVSTSDLHARIAKWITLESLRPQPVQHQTSAASLHQRPNLSSQFEAPRNEIETTIAQIWQSVLGVTPIGIYDKFFELGGHSLLAIQLISRMREAFQVELSAQRIFEAPTIAQLAVTIEADMRAQQLAEEEEARRAEEMLRMVEALSEDEVAALLAKQDDSSRVA